MARLAYWMAPLSVSLTLLGCGQGGGTQKPAAGPAAGSRPEKVSDADAREEHRDRPDGAEQEDEELVPPPDAPDYAPVD